jgi:hypothetical protein
VTRPDVHGDPEPLVDRILAETGGDIVLGLPLGLGKANTVANALFARARADRPIRLRIFTALTLAPPAASGDLEHRFLDPLNERLFAGYPTLAYAEALRSGDLPPTSRSASSSSRPAAGSETQRRSATTSPPTTPTPPATCSTAASTSSPNSSHPTLRAAIA